jgi:hypothetical protein
LGRVGVIGRRVDLELVEHVAAENALGKHALDGLLDREGRLALEQASVALALEAAGDARVVIIMLLVELVARQLDLGRVDDDDVVARVDVGRVLRLVLAREDAGNAAGETPEGLPLGVDHEPLAREEGLGRLGLVRTLDHRNGAFPRGPAAAPLGRRTSDIGGRRPSRGQSLLSTVDVPVGPKADARGRRQDRPIRPGRSSLQEPTWGNLSLAPS